MPRPRSLTRAAIVDAALAVLDRDGLAGLSMRALAAELGTSAMALYRYVDDREQLEEWIVERLWDSVDLTLPATATPHDRIVRLVERVRDAVAEHPAAIPLMLTHRHTTPASLRWIDSMLGVLNEAGLSGTERAIAQRSLVSYLLGTLHTQRLGPLSGPGTAAMATLPASEFPHLAETARHARHITPDDEFHLGLEILLRGLNIQ